MIPLKTDLIKSGASLNPLSATEIVDDSIAEEPAIENKEVIPEIIPEQENSVVLSEETSEELQAKSQNTEVFHIIAGSFKSAENANKLLLEIKEKGFNASLTEIENGFVRVSIETFSTRQKAINRRYELLNDYPDSWVAKQ